MNENIKKFINVQEASKYSGLDKQTIRKMFDNSQIDGFKTPTGQRKINLSSLQKLCYHDIHDSKKSECKKQNFLYARVSTKKQMDDLSRQIEFIKQQRPIYNDYILIQDIGSGINFKRKGLQVILEACIQRTIGEVVVAHRDRLCRFAFELIESIVQKAGGTIKVLDSNKNTSSEDELSQDLLSIIHIFNCRQMGKRSYKKKITNNEIISNKDLPNEETDRENK